MMSSFKACLRYWSRSSPRNAQCLSSYLVSCPSGETSYSCICLLVLQPVYIVLGRDGVHFLHSAFLCEDFAVLPVMLRRELVCRGLLSSHLFFVRYDVTTD